MGEHGPHVSFFHDHIFRIDDLRRPYSDGKLMASAWTRYLEHFGSMTVCGRERPLISDEKTLFEPASARSVSFDLLPISRSSEYLLRYPLIRRHIARLVVRSDAVIVRLPSFIGAFAADAARSFGKPLAVEVVGDGFQGWQSASRGKAALIGRAFDRRMQRHVASADAVIYVTNQYLQKRYPSCATLQAAASNVELDWESVLEAGGGARPEPDFEFKDAPVLGLIGSYTQPNKGVDIVIKALPLLIRDYPRMTFRVLGHGDLGYFADMASKLGVREHVDFCATRPSGMPVLSWLRDVDIYLQPSRVEGLPRALIEAQAMGCPALGSDVAGIPELLSRTEIMSGYTPDELARLIRNVLGSKTTMARLSAENFRRAQNFNRESLVAVRSKFWRDFANFTRSRARSVELNFKRR